MKQLALLPALLLLSLCGAMSLKAQQGFYASAENNFEPFTTAAVGMLHGASTPALSPGSTLPVRPEIEARIDSLSGPFRLSLRISASQPTWRTKGLFSAYLTGESGDTLSLTLTPQISQEELIADDKYLLTASLSGRPEPLGSATIKAAQLDPRNAPYSLVIERTRAASLIIGLGKFDITPLLNIPASSLPPTITAIGLRAAPTIDVALQSAALVIETHTTASLATGLTNSDIDQLLQTATQPIEGYWRLLDFNADDKYLRQGGAYSLALVSASSLPRGCKYYSAEAGHFVMLYLSGARQNSNAWQSGMVKATLQPTDFPNVWQFNWYDPQGRLIESTTEVGSDLQSVVQASSDLHTLTFTMPSRYSTFRLQRTATPH